MMWSGPCSERKEERMEWDPTTHIIYFYISEFMVYYPFPFSSYHHKIQEIFNVNHKFPLDRSVPHGCFYGINLILEKSVGGCHLGPSLLSHLISYGSAL